MDWDDLRYFLATARAGQVTAAGQRLGVDQATVSRRVAQLEQRLATKLFDKSPRGYDLTENGEQLLSFAEEIESRVESAEEAIGGNAKKLSGAIRIGAPEGVASHLISEGVLGLCRANPELDIQIVALPRVFSLSKREVDFAIAVSRPTSGRLKVRRIADYRLHICASADYLERHPVTSRDDLKACRGIGYIQDLIFDRELDYIPLVDPSLIPHLTSTSIHVQLEWTKRGAGLCILPDFITRRHPDLVRVIPEAVSFQRTFWLVLHEDNARLDRISRCADRICAAIADQLAHVADGGGAHTSL
jgi:DNA-binding transcriptional LysR family regulator